eukprot:PhM_4_TR5973/c1_g1_i1/m.37938
MSVHDSNFVSDVDTQSDCDSDVSSATLSDRTNDSSEESILGDADEESVEVCRVPAVTTQTPGKQCGKKNKKNKKKQKTRGVKKRGLGKTPAERKEIKRLEQGVARYVAVMGPVDASKPFRTALKNSLSPDSGFSNPVIVTRPHGLKVRVMHPTYSGVEVYDDDIVLISLTGNLNLPTSAVEKCVLNMYLTALSKKKCVKFRGDVAVLVGGRQDPKYYASDTMRPERKRCKEIGIDPKYRWRLRVGSKDLRDELNTVWRKSIETYAQGRRRDADAPHLHARVRPLRQSNAITFQPSQPTATSVLPHPKLKQLSNAHKKADNHRILFLLGPVHGPKWEPKHSTEVFSGWKLHNLSRRPVSCIVPLRHPASGEVHEDDIRYVNISTTSPKVRHVDIVAELTASRDTSASSVATKILRTSQDFARKEIRDLHKAASKYNLDAKYAWRITYMDPAAIADHVRRLKEAQAQPTRARDSTPPPNNVVTKRQRDPDGEEHLDAQQRQPPAHRPAAASVAQLTAATTNAPLCVCSDSSVLAADVGQHAPIGTACVYGDGERGAGPYVHLVLERPLCVLATGDGGSGKTTTLTAVAAACLRRQSSPQMGRLFAPMATLVLNVRGGQRCDVLRALIDRGVVSPQKDVSVYEAQPIAPLRTPAPTHHSDVPCAQPLRFVWHHLGAYDIATLLTATADTTASHATHDGDAACHDQRHQQQLRDVVASRLAVCERERCLPSFRQFGGLLLDDAQRMDTSSQSSSSSTCLSSRVHLRLNLVRGLLHDNGDIPSGGAQPPKSIVDGVALPHLSHGVAFCDLSTLCVVPGSAEDTPAARRDVSGFASAVSALVTRRFAATDTRGTSKLLLCDDVPGVWLTGPTTTATTTGPSAASTPEAASAAATFSGTLHDAVRCADVRVALTVCSRELLDVAPSFLSTQCDVCVVHRVAHNEDAAGVAHLMRCASCIRECGRGAHNSDRLGRLPCGDAAVYWGGSGGGRMLMHCISL